MIEQYIISLMDWLSANKISLNLSKQLACHFHKILKKFKLSFRLDGIVIPKAESFKFLGLTIGSKLEWQQHFTLLFNKLLINKHLLLLNKNLLNTPTQKRSIYYTHIYSHLSYCTLIWGRATSSQNFLNLTGLQNSCIILINNSNKKIWRQLVIHQMV